MNEKTKKSTKKDDRRFYVYIYLNPLQPGKYVYGDYCFLYRPFYVGKGNRNRCNHHLNLAKKNGLNHTYKHKNLRLAIIRNILQENTEPIIIKYRNKMTTKQANKLEIDLITSIGRININTGPLANFTKGGDGGLGNKNFYKIIYKPEIKEKVRKTKLKKKIQKIKKLEFKIRKLLIKTESKTKTRLQLHISQETLDFAIEYLNIDFTPTLNSKYRQKVMKEKRKYCINKNIDKVQELINKGYNKSKIRKTLRLSYDLILDIFKELNIDYENYDPLKDKNLKLYNRIKELQNKNLKAYEIFNMLNIGKYKYYDLIKKFS